MNQRGVQRKGVARLLNESDVDLCRNVLGNDELLGGSLETAAVDSQSVVAGINIQCTGTLSVELHVSVSCLVVGLHQFYLLTLKVVAGNAAYCYGKRRIATLGICQR